MATSIGLFPGQGSQKVGMGKALYDSHEVAREYFEVADSALGFSLSKLCFEGPMADLTKTEVAQPAILTVSVICYEITRREKGIRLLAAAGHSLGEYSALVAAEAITFEDAVRIVNKRGRYMQEAVPSGAGKMFAVLGKEISEIEGAISKVTKGIVEIANVNAPGQVVIAGSAEATVELVGILGGKNIELPVSAPFHCKLMDPARAKLAKDLTSLSIKPCTFPVYANFSSQAVTEPNAIRSSLESQVCGRVRWVESIENLIRATGADTAVEFGEGNTLTGLLKRINPTIRRLNINSIESLGTL